jgi:predicted dinucleotide-binding enzyme
MNIGIIGAGNIGSALARHLTKVGHQVMIGNSRGPASLGDIASATGATAATAEEAAENKDVVIIAIPEKAIPNLPKSILASSKAIIVDAGNYYPSRDGKNADIENGSTDSEWVASVIGHPVVKAFNNIIAQSLESKTAPAGSPNRIALSVAGDNEAEKQIIMGLIEKIGFDAIDGGSLAESWRQQPGEAAYCKISIKLLWVWHYKLLTSASAPITSLEQTNKHDLIFSTIY